MHHTQGVALNREDYVKHVKKGGFRDCKHIVIWHQQDSLSIACDSVNIHVLNYAGLDQDI
jgi:hypothetical protein